jgi:hypothetical protein
VYEQPIDEITEPADAHSFVLRIWLEEAPQGPEPGRWRGHITNVLTGRQRAVERFSHIEEFLAQHLREWAFESSEQRTRDQHHDDR